MTGLRRQRAVSYVAVASLAASLVCSSSAWPAGGSYSGTLTLARDGANDPGRPARGKHELSQVTRAENPVAAAAWSPDGTALAVIFAGVSMPMKSLLLVRPGDERSAVTRELSFYPFGPMSWSADRR